jgi:hypothetical protein
MFPGGNVKEGYFELNVFKGPSKCFTVIAYSTI